MAFRATSGAVSPSRAPLLQEGDRIDESAASYPVETLLAKYVLGERITGQRWAGCGMVAAGVGLLAF